MRRLLFALCLLAMSCGGSPSAPSRQPFARSGSGNMVFDMPDDVTRVQITARYTGSSSNFIVWVHGQLVVNELMGTGFNETSYSGTHAVMGGQTEIKDSNGVEWSFTEIR